MRGGNLKNLSDNTFVVQSSTGRQMKNWVRSAKSEVKKQRKEKKRRCAKERTSLIKLASRGKKEGKFESLKTEEERANVERNPPIGGREARLAAK